MSKFQPPVPPQVVAVPMKDYIHHTHTDWSNTKLTAQSKRRWIQMRGEWREKDNPAYVLLTEEEAQAWRGGQ